MMKYILKILLLIWLIWMLTGCNLPVGSPPVTEPLPLEPTETATFAPTDRPTETALPTPTATQLAPEIVYDFVAQACEARWANNTTYLPCPGDLTEIGGGYVEYNDHTVTEGMIAVDAPLLIARPGEGYPHGLGLFGIYPHFTVAGGDTFRATIGCQGDSLCDVEFALEYFDANGTSRNTDWQWQHQAGDGLKEIVVDLSALAGQTVEFTLVVRRQSDAKDHWVVWIRPRIERNTNAPAPAPATATPEDEVDTTPGVISGVVDMSAAPPYMNDPGTGESMPVAVVFMNLEDGTYWWIHTSLTGHPYYQMTLPPGNYHVVAYGQGVGEEPYVAAGYTGLVPSCGQALQTVVVPPNGEVENIVIADWNWNCGGEAFRYNMPPDVPLP